MIPIHLLLENFMSHARSELDFTQFEMALVIGSDNDNPDVSNGIGKTAMFDAMLWALYGKCRFSVKKKVIKRGKASCGVTFTFKLGDSTYKIIRRTSKRTASNEVQFLVQEGAKWRDLSRDTPTATGAKIVETIGMNHDTFINSVYFRQFDVSRFASATATQKKTILKEILQIGAWDKYQDKAKAKMKKLANQLEVLDDRIKSLGDLDQLRQDNQLALETARLALQDAKSEMAQKEKELDVAKGRLADLEQLSERLGDAPARKKLLKDKEEAILTRRNRLKRQLEENNALVAEADQRCPELTRELLRRAEAVLTLSRHDGRLVAQKIYETYAGKTLPAPTVDMEKADRDVEELEEGKRLLADLKLQLRQLESLEPGEQCPCCLTEIGDPKGVVQRRKKKKKYLENMIQEKGVELEDLNFSNHQFHEAVRRADAAVSSLKEREEELRRLQTQRKRAAEANEELAREGETLAAEWKQLQKDKKEFSEIADATALADKVTVASEAVKARQAELTRARKHVMNLGVDYGNLEGHAEDLKRRMSERETLLAKKPRLATEHDVHKRLVKAFGKDGVPAIIMENVTEDLRNYANEVLKTICSEPLMIDFVTQNRTEAGSWVETFDITVSGGDRSGDEFKDLSGGEQVRISIALRLALSKILMRRVGTNIKFLLLDEVDQALDRQGIQALAETLRSLSNKFKILVITHNDSMKDMFDHIVTVRKGAAGSTVRQAAA